jgi:hypothetical protein
MKALRTIIEEIKEYQIAMGYDFESMTPEGRMQALRDYTVALMMEQAELLEEVSWKPWRKYEDQKPRPNTRKIALEWVDMLFFLVDQSFCLGITPNDILEAYETKLANNHKRISSGYSKVKT